MFDLLIRGDRVVTPHGVGQWDIAIKDGKIAAVAAPGAFGADAAGRIIDAAGKIVMPGGIDPHVHCAWIIPSLEEGGEPSFTDPPSQVSRAALHGGTTTIIDFAAREGDDGVQRTIENRDKEWAGKCYCDHAYHILLRGVIPPPILAELGEAIQSGYPTVKIFTTDITPSRRGRMVRFGDLWELFQVLAREGGLGVIHSEDNDIVMHMYDKLFREGRTGFENLAEVHNALSEDISFRRVIRLAEKVEGTALYMMHVSAASGVSAIAESRNRGFPIYGETLHQYMLFTSEDYSRPNGQIYHTYPSLKSKSDQAALWAGTLVDQHGGDRRDLLLLVGQGSGQKNRRHHRRQCRGRAPNRHHVYRNGGKTRLQPGEIRRSYLDQRRPDHGAVSAQGRDCGRRGRRYHGAGPGAKTHRPSGRFARNRLFALGRARSRGLADAHHPARQDHGRGRRILRR